MIKKIFLTFVALLSVAICRSQNADAVPYPHLQSLADSLRKVYAPDKREAVFEVTINDKNGIPVLCGAITDQAAHGELMSAVKKIRSEAIDSIVLLPAADLDDKIYGVINVSVADIRVGYDYDTEMATQALLGTPVRVLQKMGGWYRIQTPDGYIAWTHNMSFSAMDKVEFNKWIEAPKIIFTDYFGFSYSQAGKIAATRPVSDMVAGNILRYEGEAGDFYKASYPDGRTAYVRKAQTAKLDKWLASAKLSADGIVDKANMLTGIPYVWGGTSVKGMDCSGFTKTVLFMHGIISLRDASQQVRAGADVDISHGYHALKEGDLLFFGKKGQNGAKDRIRHVGFYLGNNKFIHASGFIRISSLDAADKDYDERNATEFIYARRVVNAIGSAGLWRMDEHPFYKVQK